ncbi:unnamed protein product [Didymodactylos carnosus]|uniref:Uncharacterized protein n=1 Tax=Didymodactylos carnosus TaxID=1234261 RepID=A0A814JYR8_9BILA|nr:unnamed protein product [Didymodactylos carnosus]CAF1044335.1 unnamed protein product [Didymodactylos carnosus]CAF3742085.1 unnamed protein product [Didymodactylos carnosus]CAF3814373.1 unnamed protein product [Didymodactylos carnosus]
MPLGRFPHYTAKLITYSAKTNCGGTRWPTCQVCKEAFKLNEFALCETKSVFVKGPISKSNHRLYPTYQLYYHPSNCFGFYMSTVKDDRKRIQKLKKKYGGNCSTNEYDEAYNDLLNQRFENYNLMSESNQKVLKIIMEKGEYITDTNKTNSNKRKLNSHDDSNGQGNKKRKTMTEI